MPAANSFEDVKELVLGCFICNLRSTGLHVEVLDKSFYDMTFSKK